MSVVFSGTNQGSFTQPATAANVTLQLPSGVDYIWVKNWTQTGTAGGGQGVEFYWQLGMPQGQGIIYTKTAATNALATAQLAAGTGFYLVNSTVNIPGASVATTAISNDTPPVVSTANTGSLATGSIARIFNTTGATQFAGIDFTVGTVVNNTSFQLAYAPTIVAGTTGTYRQIPYDPYFYPTYRYITNITQAAQAVVTLSVTHGYTVGQKIRFHVPVVTASTYGMTQLDNLQATIVAISTANNTITVDIDTTGFTAFAFPLTGSAGFTPARVVPVGENTATALNLNTNILSDATVNTGYFGIQLVAGAGSPAGAANDVVYWVAGKSFNV